MTSGRTTLLVLLMFGLCASMSAQLITFSREQMVALPERVGLGVEMDDEFVRQAQIPGTPWFEPVEGYLPFERPKEKSSQ